MHLVFWHWWILAVLLLVAEVIAPGVFFLWVALGAAAAGLLALLAPTLGWEVCGLAMTVVAVASAYFGRRLYNPRRQKASDQPLLNRRTQRAVGRVLTLETPIVDGVGRVQVDGLHWTVNGPDLPAGTKVRVVSADSSTLRVEAD